LAKRLIAVVEKYADEYANKLECPPNQDKQQFLSDVARYRQNAFQVTVTITGGRGDHLAGVAPEIFDSPNLPDRISTIYLTNVTQHKTYTGNDPADRFELFLDFRKPPLLDGENPVSGATPNNSNLSIRSQNEGWISEITEKVESLLDTKKVGRLLLHRSFIYDFGLWVIWMPLIIYISYKFAPFIEKHISSRSEILGIVSYVWIVFGLAMLYRTMFGYTKWAFPTVELEENAHNTKRHRVFWYTLLVGAIISIFLDMLSVL